MLEAMKKPMPVRSSDLCFILMLRMPISMAVMRVRMAAVVLICPIVPTGMLKLSEISMRSRLRMVSAGWVANPAITSDGKNILLTCVWSELIKL